MNRRTFGKTLAVGGGSTAALVLIGSQTACNPKDLSFYVDTVVGALDELKPLLPGAAATIVKAVAIAKDFDAAYKAGKFENAAALFANLSSLLSQIADDAGVNNTQVKLILAFAGVAIRAIAALLKSQAEQPGVMKVTGPPTEAQKAQRALIERLADEKAINRLYQSVKP